TIKTMYKDEVRKDVANELIRSSYSKALDEHKLNPINYPEFEFNDPSETEEFSFTAHFEIRPEVQLKKYEGLEVEKQKLNFDESRITKVIENIQKAHAKEESLTETRPAQMGDVAVIHFEGFVDNAPLEGGTGKNHKLELGSKSFIEGFEEGIVGMNLNDEKRLLLKFPENYHVDALKGKPVEFQVQLVGINVKNLPELTDEFLLTIGGPSSIDTLKADIRKDLEASESKKLEEDFRNKLLKELVKNNPVDVPASLLKEQKEILVKDFEDKMKKQGLDEAGFKEYVSKWDNDFENTAKEMVQAQFLVDAIAQKHNLSSTSDDIDNKLVGYAKQTGIDLARVKEYYSSYEQTNRLHYMITEEKVIQFLTEKAIIKEV
nr:trigger factor [Pseudobdellovibrionaceae bacterium]